MNIEELISNANVISNKIKDIQADHYNKRKKEKGNFNFFSAIVSGKNDKQHIEKYHSNVIGYFLNPNASHDFGTVFLGHFIEMISKDFNIKGLPIGKDVEKLTLEREKPTKAGRFIDISLELGKDLIIFIENKIWSGEQQNQMKDYFAFANQDHKNRLGIYLTLEGKEPDSINTKDCDGKLICISYSDITTWLKSCCKDEEVKKYPHVVSALKQYITIIENLLNTMQEDKKAIRTYLLKNANKEETLNVVKNFRFLQASIIELIEDVRNKFLDDLVENLRRKNEGKINYPKVEIHQGHFFWNGDIDNSFGLGFTVLKNDELFFYNGGGFGGYGNAILIDGINAHVGDGIDHINLILLKCFENEENWKTVVDSTAEKIIEELEIQVLPKYL